VCGRADAILRALKTAAEADRPPPEVCLDSLVLDGETTTGTTFHRFRLSLAAEGAGKLVLRQILQGPEPGPRPSLA
jgi:hypothetical protein